MAFRISGLSPEPFRHLYGLNDQELERCNVKRFVADTHPGFPDRIEMRDAKVGESVLLLNHVYQPAASPYHGSHAIFILEGAERKFDRVGEIPEVMQGRLLSMRAFDEAGMMLDAEIVAGEKIRATIENFFDNPAVAYIHAHNAIRGCYSGRIDRA